MNKKEYQYPDMEIVEIRMQASMLAGSDADPDADNDDDLSGGGAGVPGVDLPD